MASSFIRPWQLEQASTAKVRASSSAHGRRLELSSLRPTAQTTAQFGLFAWGDQQLRAREVERDLLGLATVSVRLSTAALFLCAGLAAVFGALTRHVYRTRIARILPRWSGGRVDPGLLGHTLFGIGFGEVLYLAGRVGMLPLKALGAEAPDATLLALAVLLGVLGGFGGVRVLDGLLILPSPKAA